MRAERRRLGGWPGGVLAADRVVLRKQGTQSLSRW